MENLEITNIKLKILENSKILAIANIVLNESIVISGIRLFNGKDGYYILFPARNGKNNRKYDVVFPCNNELRKMILKKIQEKFIEERTK